MHLLTLETAVNNLLGLVGDRHQTIDEELGDARNEFHHRTHDHTERQHSLDILMGCQGDEHTDDDTQHQGLGQYAELTLHALGIEVELGETGDLLQQPADSQRKRHETLAERLRNRDAWQVVVALEAVGRKVGTNQRNHVADDGGEVTPQQALVEDEINHGANEGEMPVVPQVDIHRACGLRDEHQEVDTQADRDDERPHGRVVGHGGGSRPTHIEDVELQMVDLRDSRERVAEVGGEQ